MEIWKKFGNSENILKFGQIWKIFKNWVKNWEILLKVEKNLKFGKDVKI